MAFQDAFSCKLKHHAAKCVLPTVMNSEVNVTTYEVERAPKPTI